MKALTCEMCGSTNIVREDGLFICKSCGTRYSPNQVKKMSGLNSKASEAGFGVVDIDNALKLARIAINGSNPKEALEYANRILETACSCLEAWQLKMEALDKTAYFYHFHVEDVIAVGEVIIKLTDGQKENEILSFYLDKHLRDLRLCKKIVRESSIHIEDAQKEFFKLMKLFVKVQDNYISENSDVRGKVYQIAQETVSFISVLELQCETDERPAHIIREVELSQALDTIKRNLTDGEKREMAYPNPSSNNQSNAQQSTSKSRLLAITAALVNLTLCIILVNYDKMFFAGIFAFLSFLSFLISRAKVKEEG